MSKEEKFLRMLDSPVPLGYDVETNGLQWQKCNVCGYSLSDGVDSVYVPTRHEGGGNISQPENFELAINEKIKLRKQPLVGWNLKFDTHMSANHNVDIPNTAIDAMVMEALLNEFRGSYALESIAKHYPDVPNKKGKELYIHIAEKFGCKPDRNSMGLYYRLAGDDPIADDYARGDTLTTIGIYNHQKRELAAQDLDVVAHVETKLNKVLQKMERRGFKIDLEALDTLKTNIASERYEAYCQIPLKENLEPTNIRSNKDLQEYFSLHGITDWPMTEKGNPSFVTSFLKDNPAGEAILNARKLDHFENSFLTPINNYIHGDRIYTNFNQTMSEIGGTKSGRLSSSRYNAHQVPKRDKYLGKLFRKIFLADEGYTVIEFDYSQCEPRLYAQYSGEPTLVNGYNATPFVDMHSIAAEYMSIDRGRAKNINLGLLYVMGITKLSSSLGISYDEAKRISQLWHRTFPNVSGFTKKAAQRAEQRGYVKTILGRRARFPDPRYSYKAANRIIQGGSADILKYKMVQIDDYIMANGLEDEIHMLLNIHDALVFQIRDEKLEIHSKKIAEILEDVQSQPFNLNVPFVADCPHSGKNWGFATYGEY
jgi:DNA polymerase-1